MRHSSTAKPTGVDILRHAERHIGEKYVFGILVPKSDPDWKGPWDCAEFATWLVYQVATFLYGCIENKEDPDTANAYTGSWARDAKLKGTVVQVEQAATIQGAAILRIPVGQKGGHIVISDGHGKTVEAHSSKKGVIKSTLAGRRWDIGILVPGIAYDKGLTQKIAQPTTMVYRVTKPRMKGSKIRRIQHALERKGFNPGGLSGTYHLGTRAAVMAFQLSCGLLADGEVGAQTANVLGIRLPILKRKSSCLLPKKR